MTRRQITLQFNGGDAVPGNVFDAAQKKVFVIMENDSFPRFLRSTYYKGVSSRRGPLESLLGTLLSSRNSSDSHRTAGVNDSTRISNSRNNNNNNSVSNEASLSRALTSGNSKLSPHYTTDDVAKVVRALCEPTAVH